MQLKSRVDNKSGLQGQGLQGQVGQGLLARLEYTAKSPLRCPKVP